MLSGSIVLPDDSREKEVTSRTTELRKTKSEDNLLAELTQVNQEEVNKICNLL